MEEREREEEGKTERSSRKKFDTGSKYPDRSTLSIKSIRDNTIPRLTSFAISEPAFFPVASLIKRKVIRGPSNFDGNDFFFIFVASLILRDYLTSKRRRETVEG